MSGNPPNTQDVTQYSQNYNAQLVAESLPQHQNKSWFSDFKLLYSMMSDKKFKLQSSTVVTVGGALAYVVLPTDVVPDFIPVVGWLDDALVLKIVMDSAKGEINRFKHYIGHNAH